MAFMRHKSRRHRGFLLQPYLATRRKPAPAVATEGANEVRAPWQPFMRLPAGSFPTPGTFIWPLATQRVPGLSLGRQSNVCCHEWVVQTCKAALSLSSLTSLAVRRPAEGFRSFDCLSIAFHVRLLHRAKDAGAETLND